MNAALPRRFQVYHIWLFYLHGARRERKADCKFDSRRPCDPLQEEEEDREEETNCSVVMESALVVRELACHSA